MATNKMANMNVAPDYSEAGMPGEPDYCPCLYLNEEQCEALGIDGNIDAGTVIGLTVRALVQRSTTSVDDEPEEGDEEGPDVSLTLKITDAQIVATPEAGSRTDTKSMAATLYSRDDAN